MRNHLKIILALALACSTNLFAGEEIIKTNLPVTIVSQVVTNVVEGNNQRGCGTCEMLRGYAGAGAIPAIYHPFHESEPWHAADEKWTITNIIKRVTVTVDWNGKILTHTDETVIQSTTNRWKLRAEWQKE